MNILSQILSRYGTRNLLIAVAVALLLVNIGRFSMGYYADQLNELAGKSTQLESRQMAVSRLPELRNRIEALRAEKTARSSYLFSAHSAEEAASQMQIFLQKQMTESGLVLQTLQPGFRKNEQGEIIGDVAIKARLTGTLNQFATFMATLYKSDKLFQLDNVTLKASRTADLTLFLELKGFYQITP